MILAQFQAAIFIDNVVNEAVTQLGINYGRILSSKGALDFEQCHPVGCLEEPVRAGRKPRLLSVNDKADLQVLVFISNPKGRRQTLG